MAEERVSYIFTLSFQILSSILFSCRMDRVKKKEFNYFGFTIAEKSQWSKDEGFNEE